MPPAFAEANVAGNASIILHTLAGLIGVTALFGLLFFYMWAGPFLFGLERSFKQAISTQHFGASNLTYTVQVYKHNWLLGPSVKAQML